MSFTDEKENSNSLPFLDVLITREQSNPSFSTNVYRKPTFSGLYTNFKSFLPLKYKTGLLWTLLDRCFNIVSSFVLLDEQFRKMRSIFRKNSYPAEFVDQCINSYLTKKFSPPLSTVKKKEVTICLPYLGRLSLQIVKRLQWTVAKHLKNCNLRVVFNVD